MISAATNRLAPPKPLLYSVPVKTQAHRACKLILLLFCLQATTLAHSQSTAESNLADFRLANFQLDQLQTDLQKMPPGPNRDYLAGLLANRRGQIPRSVQLLQRALPNLQKAHDPRASEALNTLADDYTKLGNYASAAKAYDRLFALFPNENKGGTRDDAGVLHLLASVPPMTMTWHGPTRLKTTRNAIGSTVTKLTVNGVTQEWLLDTGANYSVVSRTFAEKLHAKILPGHAQTGSGTTGLENSLQAAVLPTLHVGGATLENVVLLVLDDANLKISFGDRSYQINAILGYPVFQTMKVITFTHDGYFEAGPSARRNQQGIPLYMRRLTPVVNLKANGVLLPFTLDTGASSTDLSLRYYDRFKSADLSWKPNEYEAAGAGGNIKRKIYTQPELHLEVGDKTAILKDIAITPQKTNAGLDELYGNIGQDLFQSFESFTLDFATMTFKVGDPVQPQPPK